MYYTQVKIIDYCDLRVPSSVTVMIVQLLSGNMSRLHLNAALPSLEMCYHYHRYYTRCVVYRGASWQSPQRNDM